MLYLDHASTAHPKPDVMTKAIAEYLQTIGASPGRGTYDKQREAADLVASTRTELSQLFDIADSNNLAFTSNATHSLNILLKGFLKLDDHVIICSNSHNAAIRPLESLKKDRKVSYDILEISFDGTVNLEKVERLLNKKTALVVINHASNVTGVVTDIQPLACMLENKGIPLLLDVAQTAGIIPLNIQDIPISFLAGTGHKTLQGPSGIGFLYAKDPFLVSPLMEGGSSGNASSSPNHPILSPYRFEAGTLNYLGIAGLNASIRYCHDIGFHTIRDQSLQIIGYLTKRLQEVPYITLYGNEDLKKKVPIISFNLHDIPATTLSHILNDKYSIATRAGLHCAPNCHRTIGTFPGGAVRISIGHLTTKTDIDRLIGSLYNFRRTQ